MTTTTSAFQSRPDSYSSQKECDQATLKRKEQTNPRYKNFTQTHFTAGDEDQFEQYREATNGAVCNKHINLSNNLFVGKKSNDGKMSLAPLAIANIFKDLKAVAVIDTFRYIFNKFKKGIFVKIKNNKLAVFLPFSKAHFVNEWSKLIKIDKKFKSIDSFLSSLTLRPFRYDKHRVSKMINQWYANNCILRYDINPRTKLPNEGDTNISTIKSLFETLCRKRTLPDIELFINRRDFPILTKNGTEPYEQIWGSNQKLVSHAYKKFAPILSMSKTTRFADILMPTYEDWARISSEVGIYFPRSCRNYEKGLRDIPWKKRKDLAVWRGSTTGCGVTPQTNTRLKLALMASKQKVGKDFLVDAGITKWNTRPRKLKGKSELQSINVSSLQKAGVNLVGPLTSREQATFKYIINIDGHVSAFRLSAELGYGSVILLVGSKWKIWYSDMLEPYVHYVPVREDLGNLFEQIRWCRANDDKCKQIVVNALTFFDTYLQEDGILDFLQQSLINIKKQTGIYLYNIHTPREIQISQELKKLTLEFPETKKTMLDIFGVPRLAQRTFGLLQGVHWAINLALHTSKTSETSPPTLLSNNIFRFINRIAVNKLGVVDKFSFGNIKSEGRFAVAIKRTKDLAKIQEHIHDAFVGLKAVNILLKDIPNFAYTFGLSTSETSEARPPAPLVTAKFGEEGSETQQSWGRASLVNALVINEFIPGKTLFEFLSNQTDFSFEEFIFIFMQICLTLQVAQNRVGFVHYDLAPWNIILFRGPKVTIDYSISSSQTISVSTNCIPVIIDYGKSHVIVDGKHHGFVNMFNVCTIQDVLNLLVNSLGIIKTNQNLNKSDFSRMMKLANFMSRTGFRKNVFRKAKDLGEFVKNARRFSVMTHGNKFELSSKTPMDMFDWLLKISQKAKYKFLKDINLRKDGYKAFMSEGNSRQIFDYILSNTVEERAQTYFDVFSRLKHCTIPQPSNLFFVYYAVQVLNNNLKSLKKEMIKFLKSTQKHRLASSAQAKFINPKNPILKNMFTKTYFMAYESSIKFLKKVYLPKIKKLIRSKITFQLHGDFTKLIHAPYTEETFLLPDEIFSLLNKHKSADSKLSDLSNYREIIKVVLTDRGEYQLPVEVRKDYVANFSKLLNTSPLVMANNLANAKTLRNLSSLVFLQDEESLSEKLKLYKTTTEFKDSAGEAGAHSDCTSAKKYLLKYEEILKILK